MFLKSELGFLLPVSFMQYPKVYGYYRFEKQYFQKLKDDGVIVVRPSNWAQMLDEEVDSVDYTNVDKPRQALEHPLEQKLDNVIWKMNSFILCIVCVVFGCVMMYFAMK